MIGLFIGSFNPVTLAHLEIAEISLNNKLVDKVIFVPVNSNKEDLINIFDRINMLNLSLSNNMDVDTIMINNNKFDYSIISKLKDKYHNIKIIMGTDLLEKLDKFDNLNYLLEQNYIIFNRGIDGNLLIEAKYKKYKEHFEVIDYNNICSSSIARKLIKDDNYRLVNRSIVNYIKKNNLYK